MEKLCAVSGPTSIAAARLPKTLDGWIRLLFATYHHHRIDAATIAGYELGLRNVPPADYHDFFAVALQSHGTGYPPAPGEMFVYWREFVKKRDEQKERDRAAVRAPDPNCPQCGGSAYRMHGGFAVVCECTKKENIK